MVHDVCKGYLVYSSFPSPQNRDYYCRDGGIRDDVIRKVEQEAIRLAEGVHNFELYY